MYNLKQSLLLCGYKGPCENLNLLRWALRAGACSQFFLDLLQWLEEQLRFIVSTQQVRNNISRLFGMLRQSILMKPSYGSEAAVNPKEFRLQALKVLVGQLQLRRIPEYKPSFGIEVSALNSQNITHLTVTLNLNAISETGNRNQRLVRYKQNAVQI